MAETVSDVFQRVEDKYRISSRLAGEIVKEMKSHIRKDIYFEYTVHCVYYDSKDSRMIIASMNGTGFKEKLRLRCYEQPDDETMCFLETKKKYDDIVYKRRITLKHAEAVNYLEHGKMHGVRNNTADEIDYLMNRYGCEAKTAIFYDRTCYAGIEEKDLRITFDRNIRYRTDEISLSERGDEQSLIGNDVIMEIKAMDRYPLWLVRILTDHRLVKQSFSKYGTIYRNTHTAAAPTGRAAYAYAMNNEERSLCSVQY